MTGVVVVSTAGSRVVVVSNETIVVLLDPLGRRGRGVAIAPPVATLAARPAAASDFSDRIVGVSSFVESW